MGVAYRRVESGTLGGVQLIAGKTSVYKFCLHPAGADCTAVFYDGTDTTGTVLARLSAQGWTGPTGRTYERPDLRVQAETGVYVVTTGTGAVASVLVPARRGL